MINLRNTLWAIASIFMLLILYIGIGLALFYNSDEQSHLIFADPRKISDEIQYAQELKPRWPMGENSRTSLLYYIQSIESTIWYPMHSRLIKMEKYRSLRIFDQGTDHVRFVPIDRREADDLYAEHQRISK